MVQSSHHVVALVLYVAAVASALCYFYFSTWSAGHNVALEAVEGQCPGTTAPNGGDEWARTGLARDFHGMLNLPSDYAPGKISFRSCVSHTSETVVADIGGPGCVRIFWLVTGMGKSPTRPKHCVMTRDALMMIVRIYFDGSATPSIEAPLGSLFGIHHDFRDSWGNLEDGYGADNSMFKVSENGAMSLVAPMPFANGCRITLQDENPENVKMRVWAQVSYHQYNPACPMPEPLRLRALYRQQDIALNRQYADNFYQRSYHVGHSTGSGYLLGFTMGITVKDHQDWWYHNGAEMIIVDHTTRPRVMKGTGGEDFFGTSCHFSRHHNFPEWGFMYGNNSYGFSAYRFFVSDFQIKFSSEFSFEYGANRNMMESVMYWYQTGPAERIQPLPTLSQRLPAPGVVNSPPGSTPPPTGAILLWELSSPYPLTAWTVDANITVYDGLSYNYSIAPVFGFVSIGEHFFRYGSNERYPVNQEVYGRATLESPADGATPLVITHDDPFELILNGQLVHRKLQSTFGFHSYAITVMLKEGTNTFHCRCSNKENTNTRAWVFGLVFNQTSVHWQPDGSVADIDGGCG
jgi:hypothetical protein